MRLYATFYLLSSVVLLGWLCLIIIGFFDSGIMHFANSIGVPTVAVSVACMTLFKWLTAREQKKGIANG